MIRLLSVVSSGAQPKAWNGDYCLVREGVPAVLPREETALYESKLFVSKDDVARFVFLTNKENDGDRSAAVYRAPRKAGSLPGGYWITSTEASASLSDCIPTAAEKARVDLRSVTVSRADAPIPASTAKLLHGIWVAMLGKSQKYERAVPCAPTIVISARAVRGARLKAVSVSLEEDSPCLALMRLGLWLVEYPQLPRERRVEAVEEIDRAAGQLSDSVKAK